MRIKEVEQQTGHFACDVCYLRELDMTERFFNCEEE